MSTLTLARTGDLGIGSVLLYVVGFAVLAGLWIKGIVVAASVSLTTAVIVGIVEPLPIIIGLWHTITHGLL